MGEIVPFLRDPKILEIRRKSSRGSFLISLFRLLFVIFTDKWDILTN